MAAAAGSRHAASGTDGSLGPEPPAALLARLLEAIGVEASAPDAAAPFSSHPPDAGASWQETLERACAPHPLRLRPVFLSPAEAVAAAGHRTPLVGFRGAGGPGWFALLGRTRGRALFVSADGPERWLRPRELARKLGVQDACAALPWVLVETERPGLQVVPTPDGPRLAPLRRLIGLVRPERADLWAIVLYAIVIGGLTLATPIAVQQLVNTVAFGGLVQPVVVVALLLFAGLAFSALLSVIQAYTAESIQRRVFVRVTMDLADRLPRVRADAFDARHGPELVNRVFDVFTIQKTGAALLLEGTSVVLQTGVGLVVLSLYHPLMLGFSILLVAGISLVIVGLGRGAVETAIGESNAKYAMAGWMEELARHPATFRHPCGRRYALERADRIAIAYVGARRRHYRLVLRQLSGALGLQVLAGSALLALGGALVVSGQLTLGQLVASELIITAIVAAVAKLGKQLESYYDLLAAVDKLGVLFDLPLEREGGSPPVGSEGPASVELRKVSLRRADRTSLPELSLRVAPGERLLVTGPVGSGKSTLLELLMGLRTPSTGFVALDGIDLRDRRLGDVREQVVCVGGPEVFPGSILDNVRVARPWASAAEVGDALARVGVLDTVRTLPQGLRTPLSSSGAPLSDGEVAAVMLARAIVAQPRLLLLDEPALRLEPEVAERALDALVADDAPWTLIAVSRDPRLRSRFGRAVELPMGAAPQGEPEDAGDGPC